MDKQTILDAIKTLGPSSPVAIGDHLKVEASAVGYHLRKLAAAGELKAAGTKRSRTYALPGQKLDGVPPKRAKGKKKANGKARKTKKRAARVAKAAPATPSTADFIAACTVDHRLVVIDGTQQPQIFSLDKTSAIADLIHAHFEAP